MCLRGQDHDPDWNVQNRFLVCVMEVVRQSNFHCNPISSFWSFVIIEWMSEWYLAFIYRLFVNYLRILWNIFPGVEWNVNHHKTRNVGKKHYKNIFTHLKMGSLSLLWQITQKTWGQMELYSNVKYFYKYVSTKIPYVLSLVRKQPVYDSFQWQTTLTVDQLQFNVFYYWK